MKILILITAYNVEKFLESVLQRIPDELLRYDLEILIIDDFSSDGTKKVMNEIVQKYKKFRITCLYNKKNLGYGGNQKVGYHYAIINNFDYVIMLHGDGQYAPEYLLNMLRPLFNNEADAVQGSRMINKKLALKGNMPLYKFLGNICLTAFQNLLTGMKLSEYHSGYRAYSVSALKEIPFRLNSDFFHFDTQILLQFKVLGKGIKEISIPTYYGEQISSLNSIKYGLSILKTTIKFFFQKYGIFYDRKFSFKVKKLEENYLSKLDFKSTHSITYKIINEKSNIISIGCGSGHLEKKLFYEKKCKIDAIDQYDNSFDFIENFKKIDLDLDELNFDFKKYKYIIMLDVLEHLKNPEKILEFINYNMSFNASQKLIISVPNTANILIRLSLLFGNFNYGERGILDKTHLRLFTLNSIKNLLLESNFKIKKTIAIPIPFPLVIKNKNLSKILMKINNFLILISKSVFSFQLLFIVEAMPSLAFLLEEAKKKR